MTLTDLTPENILIYYDGPRTFTTRSSEGHLLLVSWLKDTETSDIYVVVPTSVSILQALQDNQLTLRNALNSETLWIVEQTVVDGKLTQTEVPSLAEVDRRFTNALPIQ